MITARWAISVDELSRQFAIVEAGRRVVCKAEEIIALELRPPGDKEIATTLIVETRNSECPRFERWSAFKSWRLSEIYDRLKVLRTDPGPVGDEGLPKAVSDVERNKLQESIEQLTQAVKTLAAEVRQLASEVRHEPSRERKK